MKLWVCVGGGRRVVVVVYGSHLFFIRTEGLEPPTVGVQTNTDLTLGLCSFRRAGKRRRRSRAANRESLLSTKSEPVGGEGGYRTTRSIGGYPPGQMPPETPGGNFAMRYQKSIPGKAGTRCVAASVPSFLLCERGLRPFARRI